MNELSHRFIKERGVFLSAYDMHPYTKGAGKELGLHSQTLQCIAGEYVTCRKQFKKARLNWRKSGGVRRSLGWIPVNTGAAQWKNGQVYHNGHYFGVWDSYGLSQYKFRSGSFNEDVTYSAGQWGGVRAAVNMRTFLSELGCLPVSAMIHLPRADEVLTGEGDYTEGVSAANWSRYCERAFSQLEWWAMAANKHRDSDEGKQRPLAFIRNPSQRNAP